MPTITLTTSITASIERCFNVARDIDVHIASTAHTGEKAIAGRTSGLIELGETVTWRAKHFGIWQNLTSKVTDFNYPTFFADEQVRGAFKSFRHVHRFQFIENKTVMYDVFDYESPLGWFGRLADRLFLKRYMTRLLEKRNLVIKEVVEKA